MDQQHSMTEIGGDRSRIEIARQLDGPLKVVVSNLHAVITAPLFGEPVAPDPVNGDPVALDLEGDILRAYAGEVVLEQPAALGAVDINRRSPGELADGRAGREKRLHETDQIA